MGLVQGKVRGSLLLDSLFELVEFLLNLPPKPPQAVHSKPPVVQQRGKGGWCRVGDQVHHEGVPPWLSQSPYPPTGQRR